MTDTPLTVEEVRGASKWARIKLGIFPVTSEVLLRLCVRVAELEAQREWFLEIEGGPWDALFTELTKEE